MKVLRVIGNVIIGIILFGLIFVLTFTRSTKKFLEKDLILGVVKEKIVESIKEESGELTNKGQELIDNMLDDNEANNIIQMVFDNFEKYQSDKANFKVSDKDIEVLYSYAVKYKSTIIEISGNKIKDISDEELKKIFSEENINSLVNDLFSGIDKDVGEGIDVAIKTYNKATSSKTLIILIVSIVLFILLLMLINWSLFKWMLITGIDLIISGVLTTIIFVAGVFISDLIKSSDATKEIIGEINFTGYVIWGSIELVLGIILIVIYNVNRKHQADSLDSQVNNL